MLQLNNITKIFGENTAVHAVNFTVEKLIMIGIIGRSGADKSKLLRMLNRLACVMLGAFTFDGLNVTALRNTAKSDFEKFLA